MNDLNQAITLIKEAIDDLDFIVPNGAKEYKKASLDVLVNEIERLNNNWNELEQWIEKERDKWGKYNPDCFVYYQSILDRMEELKGVDKE